MEQNFVVLTDGRRAPAPAPTENPISGQSGNARKHPMEDQHLVFNRTKGPRVERGARGWRGEMAGEPLGSTEEGWQDPQPINPNKLDPLKAKKVCNLQPCVRINR